MSKLKKVLLTGASGQLGTALMKLYSDPAPFGFEWHPLTRQDLDLATNRKDLFDYLKAVTPDIIVNCAAYTNVDGAETHQEECEAINYTLPLRLNDYCQVNHKHLVHISTDYVFGGNVQDAFVEVDEPAPLNVYGATKSKADQILLEQGNGRVHILRTSWLYGPRAWGHSFYKSILEKGLHGEPLKVVTDEVGSPTSSLSLARAIVDVLYCKINGVWFPWGLYHCADEGSVSRYEFAKAILALDAKARETEITPITREQLPVQRSAVRPNNSTLDCGKLMKLAPDLIRPWQEGLKAVYVLDKKEYKDEI